MHDSVMLEAKGRPTAMIATSEFVLEARTQRDALGMTGLEPVIIAHPLSSLTDEEIGSVSSYLQGLHARADDFAAEASPAPAAAPATPAAAPAAPAPAPAPAEEPAPATGS